MVCLLPLLLTAALGPAEPPHAAASVLPRQIDVALLTAPDRRVRTTNNRIQQMLADGMRRSTTFAGLMHAVNRTDVIVYIEAVTDMPTTVAGRLLLLPLAGNQRYLRIQVRPKGSPVELIAIIGHELRHALEIAEADDVRDQAALIAFYRRIGLATQGGSHSYDTAAAQEAGRQVHAELVS